MDLLIAVICFLLASMLFMMHEHVLFNYAGSRFELWDNRMKRPWWKNNSRPELKKYIWLPMIRDGYHFLGWLMQLCYWGMFGAAIFDKVQSFWGISYLGLWMGVFAVIVHNVSYGWFFKDK